MQSSIQLLTKQQLTR